MDFDTYAIGGTAPERTVDYEVHKHILALDESLGPIELGDGATVLRRHLPIFHVMREAVAWSKEKSSASLALTFLDAATTNVQVHLDYVMVKCFLVCHLESTITQSTQTCPFVVVASR